MANVLRLWKTYNNGVITGQVAFISPESVLTPFNLTSSTVTVEIFNRNGAVAASFAGTIVTAADGIYTAKPDADDLNSLIVGASYCWRAKVVNADYPQGLIFGEDSDGNFQPIEVIGNATGV